MQYVVMRGKKEEYDLFSDEDSSTVSKPTLDYEQCCKLEEFLKAKDNPANSENRTAQKPFPLRRTL